MLDKLKKLVNFSVMYEKFSKYGIENVGKKGKVCKISTNNQIRILAHRGKK